MLLGLQFMSFLFVQFYQAQNLEKELNEVKDRNAALQSQLTEYAGVISDQSKVWPFSSAALLSSLQLATR